MSENYQDIAKLSWENIPKVKTLPDGSYLLRGRNATYLPSKDGNTSPRVLFFYSPKEAMDDVDSGALSELGADYDISGNQVVSTFWIEKGPDWDKVRTHLANHGVDVAGSVPETLKAFKGTEVIAYLTSRSYVNNAGQSVDENVPSNFTKVE